MKKALVILLALAMVFGAFADDLAAVTIKGEASFGYKINLDDSKMGMTNGATASQEYTITLVTADIVKSTEGSGIWGELVVKSSEATIKQGGCNNSGAATLDTAKIHFGDIVTMNILKPSLAIGAVDGYKATGATVPGLAAVGKDLTGQAGFTLTIAPIDMLSIDVAFADNGVVKTDAKKFGFAGGATIKPIADLSIYAGASYNGETEDLAIAANAKYSLALNDTMTVKVAGGITNTDALAWAGTAMLSWGAADEEPGFKFVANKCSNGVSVALSSAKDIVFGVYDSTFLADFGLKIGADYAAKLDALKGTLNAGVKFAKTIDIVDVAAYFDFQDDLAKSTNSYGFGASVANATLIQNVTLKAAYDNEVPAEGNKGAITLSATMSF